MVDHGWCIDICCPSPQISYHYYYIIMVDHGWCIDICCSCPQISYHYYYIIMVDHGWCIDICCPSPQCAAGQFIVSCNNMGLRTYWAAKQQFWDVSYKYFLNFSEICLYIYIIVFIVLIVFLKLIFHYLPYLFVFVLK